MQYNEFKSRPERFIIQNISHLPKHIQIEMHIWIFMYAGAHATL